jgi:hypothetical protein
MDLATSIVQAAERMHQSDREKKRFKIELLFRFRFKFELYIIAAGDIMYLEFRGVVFKWKKDNTAYGDTVIEFLCSEMTEDVKRKVAHDVRFNNYIPKNDPKYADIAVDISYDGRQKFYNVYSFVAPKDIIWYYIKILTMVHDVHNE